MSEPLKFDYIWVLQFTKNIMAKPFLGIIDEIFQYEVLNIIIPATWTVHYENTPIQIYRKFHLQKLTIFR